MPKKKALPKPALDPTFSAKKPVSAWNRPLQLDSKGLFGALAKGAVHGFTGQWTELGGDAVDGLAALGIDSHDAPHLSWLLLRRSLASAMAKLRAYERTGVREVWLVDPTGPMRTEILQRHGLRLQPVTPEGGVVPSIALPGFRLRLEWLWPEGRFIPVRDAIDSMLS